MAVYTKLTESNLKEFFQKYNLGNILKANEALNLGIINKLVSQDNLKSESDN